jgi:hypothetical protein
MTILVIWAKRPMEFTDLQRLLQLMPPPVAPIDCCGDWDAVEQELTSCLPDDYKRFIEHYGTGRIAGLLWPLNPFSSNKHLNLLQQCPFVLDIERKLRDRFPKYHPWRLFPEPGGLLPWCVTDNGDYVMWRTVGGPNDWTTFIYEPRGTVQQDCSCGMSSFLSRWLSNEIEVKIFDREPIFEQNPIY